MKEPIGVNPNYPNLTYKLFDAENFPKNVLQFREVLKTRNFEIEFLNELDHEIQYARFILNESLPILIEKNKLIDFQIFRELG